MANSLLFDIHDSIRDLPGSTPARKLILEHALRYLDSLAAETGGDLSLERELATAYERVGEVQGDYVLFNIGETQNALNSYQKALTLRKAVAASRSATWEDELALAKSYRLVAAQLRVTGNLPAAFQNVEEAISIGERLRNESPENKQILAELRTAYERKGHIQRGSWSQASPGDGAAALESFREAMEIDATLLRLEPSNEDFQYIAGADEMYYAEVLPADRNAERLQRYQHVLDIDKKINEHTPTPRHTHAIAEDYNRIAMWYDGQRDHVKSAEYHRHYLEIVRNLYAADPQNTVFREEVVVGSANLAIEIGFLGHESESKKLLDSAVTLMQSVAQASQHNTSHKGMLAAVLVMRADNFIFWKNYKSGLEDYGAAINIFRQLLAANPNNVTARKRLLICRIAVAHTKLRMGILQAASEMEGALTDSTPLLSDASVNDDTLYAAAVGYADLGNIEFRAARSTASTTKKSHLQSARRWYNSSASALNRVQDLLGQSESEAFGPLHPSSISQQLAICESALSTHAVPIR